MQRIIGCGLILSLITSVVNCGIFPPTSLVSVPQPLVPGVQLDTSERPNNAVTVGLHKIRGGNAAVTNQSPTLHVRAILIPRQTSILTPMRFLSFLLINVSFNYCMQTSGRPMEDAVRRILNMPFPIEGNESQASKVTPLHVYVAKKLLSSATSSTSVVEMLPPAHLPSPLPLLGLFLSIMLYIGGTILLPKWSVYTDAFLNYERFDLDDEESIEDASNTLENWIQLQNNDEIDPYYQSALKRPSTPAVLVNDGHGGSNAAPKKEVICPLYLSPDDDNCQPQKELNPIQHFLDHPRRYYFECGGKRYYYDPACQTDSTTSPLKSGGPNFNELSIHKILSNEYIGGLNTKSKLSQAKERYGSYSHISIPVPTLSGALISRITSPLVALQLMGRLLSVLEDETIGKSLANLGRLAIQHFFDAKRSIEAASTLANEVKENEELGDQHSGVRIWAVRPTGESNTDWIELSPSDLLPGDVFMISSETESSYFEPPMTIPVDSLLLEGTCVAEEAALTGESYPQAKIPLDIESTQVNETCQLDMNSHHRSSCLFAGTKLLYSSNKVVSNVSLFKNLPPLPRTTNTPALFLTLSSGYYSSRGSIIQSLIKSKTDLGAISSRESQLDQMRLIGVLSLWASAACIYLLCGSTGDSLFKQIIQCTRIVAAAVPSDLPTSLSASARECAAMLREESDAICSDPEALYESSKIDCIVFDKTGTITADTQRLVSVVYPPEASNFMSDIVLAGSHTLVDMNGTLVGDPVDRACFDFSGWTAVDSDYTTVQSNDTKLWVIKAFPFDSTLKMSSAIALVRHGNKYHLMALVKGALSKMSDLFDDGHSKQWLTSEATRLGKTMGYRTISLGGLDASETQVAHTLFPSGLPQQDDSSDIVERKVIDARDKARYVHRRDVENGSSVIFNSRPFALAGIAAFDAPVRESTSRVVGELNRANIQLKLLTGDDISTSLNAAKKAGMIRSQNVYVLKLNSNDGALILEHNNTKINLTPATVNKIRTKIELQDGVLCAHGDAVSAILSLKGAKHVHVRDTLLPMADLITSATPEQKNLVVNWLQNACSKNVLMCGDGVNDIAAMTDAKCSVSMMEGYGNDASIDCDIVRMERLKKRRIGGNRISAIRPDPVTLEEQAGIGNSPLAASFRIQQKISEQLKNHEGNTAPPTPLHIVLSSIMDEVRRYRILRKGGKEAASILAAEDRLRKSLEAKSHTHDIKQSSREEELTISTGEACLASSFTLLRPSIAGVESILRAGIATAASSIALFKKISLNCILSSFNLATHYKNGLRYGKWMWQCELLGIIYTDRASFTAASTPRPRLEANTRPPPSPFHPADVLSTICQAIVHIVTLAVAVSNGKKLEATVNQGSQNGFRIRWLSSNNEKGSVGAVLASLVDVSKSSLSHQESTPTPQGIFKRSPFQPNHVSNNVFIMSVFQNAVMTLVNHPGRPFSVAFLESQPLCLSGTTRLINYIADFLELTFGSVYKHTVGLSMLLCIACITETFPLLNTCLQLAPFVSKASKIELLRLLLLNLSLNYFAEYASTIIFRHDVWIARNEQQKSNNVLCAADQEERLLEEERARNISLVYMMMGLGCSILLPHIIGELKQQFLKYRS